MDGIIRGFKGDKVEQNVDFAEVRKNYFAHLDKIFSRSPLDGLFSDASLLDSPENSKDDKNVIELNIGSTSRFIASFFLNLNLQIEKKTLFSISFPFPYLSFS